MRCAEVKDRNGSYLSMEYDADGHLKKITDTLGRAINFIYDINRNLEKIEQTWRRERWGTIVNETHTYARFGYSSRLIQPNFPGLSVNGPNNASVTVLSR